MEVPELMASKVNTGDVVARMREIHGALDSFAQTKRTTAAGEVADGAGRTETWVASSDARLDKRQVSALRDGEVAVQGEGHAETTLLDAAVAAGKRLRTIAASWSICEDCAKKLLQAGVQILTKIR